MKLGNEFKRILTAMLTAAMVFTSVPTAPVLAAAPGDILVESADSQDSLVEDSNEATLETVEEEVLLSAPEDGETLNAEDELNDDVILAPELSEEGDIIEAAEQTDGTNPITVEAFTDNKVPDTQAGTSIGTVTVTAPSGEKAGKIKADLKYSTGNYPNVCNGSVSWDPYNATGYILGFKATVAEGYKIGYSLSETGALTYLPAPEDTELEFALTRPWRFDGKTIRIGAKKDADEIINSYKVELSYDNGPVDTTSLGDTDLLGKKAADLQNITEITFDPVPTDKENWVFNTGDFHDGAQYGGTGKITGTLKYQESYDTWSAGEKGYFVAFHINADTKVLAKDTVDESATEKCQVYVKTTAEGNYDYDDGTNKWKEIDYNDHIHIQKVVDPSKEKIVILKRMPSLDKTGRGLSDDNPLLKNVYYVYDLSGLKLDGYKTGKLHIDVLSQNTVKDNGKDDKVISINKIKVQFSELNSGIGGILDTEYVVSNNKGIDIDYINSKTVKITVTADGGNVEDRYEYKIGEQQVKKGAQTDAIDLSNDATTVKIEPIQAKFDNDLSLNITSNNQIDKFVAKFYSEKDGTGSLLKTEEVLVSFNGVKTVAYKDAKSVVLSDFEKDGSVINLNKTVLKLNGKVSEATKKFDLDKEGTSISVETIAKKLVTVSVDKAENFGSTIGYVVDGDEVTTMNPASFTGKVAEFYVEPGLTLSLNMIGMAQTYLFPEASLTGKVLPVKQIRKESTGELQKELWTIGKIDSNATVNIATKYYLADYKDANSAVTIKLDGDTSRALKDAEFTGAVNGSTSISTNAVFDNNGSNLTVSMTVSTNELPAHYDITEVSYKQADGTTKTLWGYADEYYNNKGAYGGYGDITRTLASTDGDRNLPEQYETFAVTIPADDARTILMADGKFEITAKQEKTDYFYNVKLTTDSGVKSVSVVYGDEILDAEGAVAERSIKDYFPTMNRAKEHFVKYGDKVSFKIETKPGFTLKKAEIKDLSDELIVSENKLTFDVATKNGAKAVITTEEAYTDSVKYKDGSDVAKTAKGYNVIYNKPVSLALLKGTGSTSMNLVAKIGGKDVTDSLIAAGVLKAVSSGSIVTGYDFNANNNLTIGKTVVVTMFAGGTSATDKSAKTVTLIVDKANKTFKFAKTEVTMPVGATQTFSATVNGTIETTLSINGVAIGSKKYTAAGITIELSDDNKTLKVTSKAALAAEKEYKVEVVDVNAKEVIGTITIKLNFDELKAALPSGSVTNTTNNTITVGNLKAGKLDTSIDGLYYYVKAVRTDDKGGTLLKNTVEAYATVSENSSVKLNLLYTDTPTEAEKLAGIEGAQYKITVKIIQRNGATAISGAESKEATLKDAMMKDGGIFETNLKLKKITKGNIYSNMGNANKQPYVFQPVYSKNTSIQRLDRVELWTADGTTLKESVNSGNVGTYLAVEDNQIKFTPGSGVLDVLGAGKYQIKAYAMEYTGVDVVATMKINVVQAITNIELRDVPAKIVKLAGKKTTATVTAYNMTGADAKNYNKKTNKVTWQLVKSGDTDSQFAYPGIAIKNGKITVDKNVEIKKDITFKIKITAKDYAGNTKVEYVTPNEIILTSQAPALNMEFANNYNGWGNPAIYKDINSTYLVSEYFESNYTGGNYSEYEYVTSVAVYDKSTTGVKTSVPANFKVSGAKLLEVYRDTTNDKASVALIGFTKPGKLKITATATDGSNRKLVKEVNVNYTSDYALGFTLYGKANISNIDYVNHKIVGGKSIVSDNYMPSGSSLWLRIDGYKYEKGDKTSLINHKVTVTGGKLEKASKNYVDSYKITPNKETTVVTIVDNTVKNRDKITITINNKAIGSSKLTAVKVTASNIVNGKDAKGKVYGYIDYSAANNYSAVSTNLVKYTIAASNKNATLSADHVVINVIKDKDPKKAGDYLAWALANNSAVNNPKTTITSNLDGSYSAPLDSTKSFYINWSTGATFNGSKLDMPNGTYKIMVTPVDSKGAATGKPVTVNVTTVKAPKANVKPVSTLDFTAANKAAIGAGSPKNVVANSVKLGVAVKGAGTELRNANIKGVLNHFATYFKLSADKKQLEFQGGAAGTDVNGKPIAAVTKLDPKTDKNELQGWIGYEYQSLDGTVHQEYYKVTLKTGKNGISK